MNTKTLSPELLYKIDAYWRAANYLSVGQLYLHENPLLRETSENVSRKGDASWTLGHHIRTEFLFMCILTESSKSMTLI